jgi:hypothetical protein
VPLSIPNFGQISNRFICHYKGLRTQKFFLGFYNGLRTHEKTLEVYQDKLSYKGITNPLKKIAGTFGGITKRALFSLVVYTLYMYYERVYFFPEIIYVFIYLFNLLLIIIIIYNKKLYNLICFIWGYGA